MLRVAASLLNELSHTTDSWFSNGHWVEWRSNVDRKRVFQKYSIDLNGSW